MMAQPGGVLTRAGHTEAGCDLARLAGLEPAAVIVEIMNDDGTMARRPDLERVRALLAKIGTIADLIRYRLRNERSVERIAEQARATEFGEFRAARLRRTTCTATCTCAGARTDSGNGRRRWCACIADTCATSSASGGKRRHWTLRAAMSAGSPSEGERRVVILRGRKTPRELADAVRRSRARRDRPRRATPVLRTYGIGAQILGDLGVTRCARAVGAEADARACRRSTSGRQGYVETRREGATHDHRGVDLDARGPEGRDRRRPLQRLHRREPAGRLRRLVRGAAACRATSTIARVPGAFELPVAVKRMARPAATTRWSRSAA